MNNKVVQVIILMLSGFVFVRIKTLCVLRCATKCTCGSRCKSDTANLPFSRKRWRQYIPVTDILKLFILSNASRNESEQDKPRYAKIQLVRLSEMGKPAILWEEMAICTIGDCRGRSWRRAYKRYMYKRGRSLQAELTIPGVAISL